MRTLALTAALLLATCMQGQKQIYVPEDLRGMDMEADTAQWSWQRSAQTRDLVFFWERGFGHDLQNVPPLEGKPMNVNLSVLMERVQSFYTFFRDTLGFASPGSKAERYKMMVMLNYSLDGTAYGGTYDNFIGALWVAPNRIQDHTMNCMAHELGHSFQLQIPADSAGDAWGGSGFYEMTSQWMLWQVNPWWLRDENYHFEAFKGLTHKAFLHLENIYHSPYVIQWWAQLHGRKSIAQLYREGRRGEDPVLTYQRLFGLTQQQFCSEMLRGYQHLANLDLGHAWQETRPYACAWTCPMDTLAGHWLRPQRVPEAYGFNMVELPAHRRTTHVRVEGSEVSHAFVGVTTDGRSIYGREGDDVFRVPRGVQLSHLYLVVMGAPTAHHPLPMPSFSDEDEGHEEGGGFAALPPEEPQQFPYRLKVW